MNFLKDFSEQLEGQGIDSLADIKQGGMTEITKFYLNKVAGGLANPLDLQDLRDFYLFGPDGAPQTFCKVET